ncbi:hypothetical protein SSCG_01023 [Streptomyces clavuligerus]|nr:hypothetical protein SSCG_01023 [Streptomyces clavuligerus]
MRSHEFVDPSDASDLSDPAEPPPPAGPSRGRPRSGGDLPVASSCYLTILHDRFFFFVIYQFLPTDVGG